MSSDKLEFYGLVFFSGQDLLPGDVLLDLDNLRQWAFKQGLIFDPDAQLLVPERIQTLAKCFSSNDKLLVAISICEGQGKPFYVENPYLPVRSLIRRAEEVAIVYWRMVPTEWDSSGEVLRFGEVRFGFWYPGCGEELCSLSTAKRVTAKFDLLLRQLPRAYEIESFKDGAKEITVDGAVRARFLKEGRLFDVNLSLEEQRAA
jgi:hypothetical protein